MSFNNHAETISTTIRKGTISYRIQLPNLLVVVFFTLTNRASTIPSIMYVVANPVLLRGLLDRQLPSRNSF